MRVLILSLAMPVKKNHQCKHQPHTRARVGGLQEIEKGCWSREQFHSQAYCILDELLLAGEVIEPSKTKAAKSVKIIARNGHIGFATWVSVLLGTRTTSCHVAGRAWSADDRAPLAGIVKKDVRFGKTAAAKFRLTSTPRLESVQLSLSPRGFASKYEETSRAGLWSTQLELGLHIVSPASKACVSLAACR